MDARDLIISTMRDISTGPHATPLALDLALTIRHDGHGGVTDDLERPEALTAWVREHAEALPDTAGFEADAAALAEVREVRAAVRALFARAVRPGEPSPADARRLLPVGEAVRRLNAAAALAPTVPVLTWDDGATPSCVRRHAPRRPLPTCSQRPWPAPRSASSRATTANGCAPATPRVACATSSRTIPVRSGASRPAATVPGSPGITSGTARRPDGTELATGGQPLNTITGVRPGRRPRPVAHP